MARTRSHDRYNLSNLRGENMQRKDIFGELRPIVKFSELAIVAVYQGLAASSLAESGSLVVAAI
jgi:hypothetical protein